MVLRVKDQKISTTVELCTVTTIFGIKHDTRMRNRPTVGKSIRDREGLSGLSAVYLIKPAHWQPQGGLASRAGLRRRRSGSAGSDLSRRPVKCASSHLSSVQTPRPPVHRSVLNPLQTLSLSAVWIYQQWMSLGGVYHSGVPRSQTEYQLHQHLQSAHWIGYLCHGNTPLLEFRRFNSALPDCSDANGRLAT